MTINYASYVLSAFFFGWLLLKEQMTQDKWLSFVLGIVGLVLIFSPSTATIGWIALLAALISGLAAGAVLILAKQIPQNTLQTTILLWTASTIGNLLMAVVIGESPPTIGWHVEWLFLIAFAVASVIASLALVKGVKLIEAGAAGILGLLEVVFAVLFGLILFSESPGLVVLIGVAVVILAAAIPYIKDFNAQKGTLT